MHFNLPAYFLLIPALAVIGWVWPRLKLHSPLRAILLLLGIIILAEPVIRHQQNSLDLYVLLDRSESTEDLIDKGLPEWQRLLESSKPSRRDQLRFINYASEVAEMGADGASFTGTRKLTKTNLAIQSIVAQSDESRPARVLLFGDGYSTEPLTEAAEQLKARNIPLDYRIIREQSDSDARVSQIKFPEQVQIGEPFLISIIVRGEKDAKFPLVLKRNGQVLTDTQITLTDGVSKLEFTDRILRAGSYEYVAEILPENDKHLGNNRATKWIEIKGGPKVILASRYENDPIAKALSALGFNIQTVSDPRQLKPGLLSGARALVLNNIPAHEVPNDFMKSIDFFVRDQGGGFMMVGGKHSFGAGGYFQSSIDSLLPVSMELKSEHRKAMVALAIVMDRSGSMAVGVGGGKTKMDLANSGAANAIELLGANDSVSVLAVDSAPTRVIPLTQIKDQKKGLAQRARKVVSAGGGIYVYTGLKAAWEELKKSKAGTRHVILFSDAQDSEEPGSYEDLIKEMRDGGATISVIGLGRDSDIDSAFLKDIAKRGEGRIFFSDQPMDIPKIFSQETVTIARSAFINEPIQVQATGRWSEISPKPITWFSQAEGYNLSYAREDATVSLVSKDEYVAPLIAHARRGLGRSVAVSFPLGGDFSESVRTWEGYGDFLQTLSRFLMGDEAPSGIALRHRLDGTQLTLDLLYDPELWSQKFSIVAPKARLRDDTLAATVDLPWARIAPGHFSLTYQLEAGNIVRGAVQVGEHALPFGPISVGASAEWAFEPERLAELRTVSNQTKGRELLDIQDAWKRPEFTAQTSLSLPLGIAFLVLALLEALFTRTDWKLPQLAMPKRATKAPRVKTWKPKPEPEPVATPVVLEEVQPEQPAPPPVEGERSSRFKRAKDRK